MSPLGKGAWFLKDLGLRLSLAQNEPPPEICLVGVDSGNPRRLAEVASGQLGCLDFWRKGGIILNEKYFHLDKGRMTMLDQMELAEQLSARGYKLTRQRRAVLEVIASSEERLNPAEVCEKAKAACPGIGLTTVYRTLDILVGLGVVRRVHLDEGCHSYAPATEGHQHHLVCSDCGNVVEFEGCDLSALLKAVASQTGFEIEDHWLQLFGRCPACQKRD